MIYFDKVSKVYADDSVALDNVTFTIEPKEFLSNYAITGLYLYDSRVVEAAKQARPSARGELEITDLHNWYLSKGELKVDIVKGEWIDAGTFESLFKASELARKKSQSTSSK